MMHHFLFLSTLLFLLISRLSITIDIFSNLCLCSRPVWSIFFYCFDIICLCEHNHHHHNHHHFLQKYTEKYLFSYLYFEFFYNVCCHLKTLSSFQSCLLLSSLIVVDVNFFFITFDTLLVSF